jgi:hypothetical protein
MVLNSLVKSLISCREDSVGAQRGRVYSRWDNVLLEGRTPSPSWGFRATPGPASRDRDKDLKCRGAAVPEDIPRIGGLSVGDVAEKGRIFPRDVNGLDLSRSRTD